MKRLVCEMCGSTDLIKQDGVFVCQSCGCKYSVEEAKKMMIEGTVRVDNSHMIENYLEMANNAYSSNNQAEAEEYCNKVIEIEPSNYQAWMLKGKAAGWQSTIQNNRIAESVSAFSKALSFAPEELKENLIEESKQEIANLCKALISLRADRFAKWPDQEETAGLIGDIATVMGTVVQFTAQADIVVPLVDIFGPAALSINGAVVQAYQNVILPEYKSDRFPFPDDDDFRKFLDRITFCTTVIESAINMCGEENEENIQRYENLIFLHKEAINACSYDSEYVDLSEQWKVDMFNQQFAGKYIPDPRNNRAYYVKLTLNEAAKAQRRSKISEYEGKIRQLENKKAAKEATEKEKSREGYWAEHIDEKMSLEAERSDLNKQIEELEKKELSIQGNDEVRELIKERDSLWLQKGSLGLFKGKEKKALQEQIDSLSVQIKAIEQNMNTAKEEIRAQIEPLRNRRAEIDAEFSKDRSPSEPHRNDNNTSASPEKFSCSILCSVWLVSVGNDKISVIKRIKEILNLGLVESKALVESAPVAVKTDISKEVAKDICLKLEVVGAVAEIR